MKKLKFIILAQIILITPLSAQEQKAEQLSQFIEKALETLEIVPGVSVSVTGSEGTYFAKGFGYADLEKKISADGQTNFYIASVTKAFNGFLAHILAQEGKINLSDNILDYKPFKNFQRKDIFKGVTVMDLLSHQSGIDNPYLSFRLAYSGEYTHDEIIDLIENETQINEKGKAFEYTNFGYYLLDVLLQEELGESWRDLLEEKVFQPLNMKHTSAYMSKNNAKALAWPHLGVFPGKVQKSYLMKTDATMHAAGGLVCNAEDAARFLRFFINQGKLDGKQIYPQKLISQTYARQVDNDHGFSDTFAGDGYGSGWRLGKYQKNQELVYHFGGYVGFFSHLSFLPKEKIGVSVFVNHELGSALGNLIANYAYDLYLGNEAALQKHEERLQNALPKRLKRYQKSEEAHQAKMAKRTWQLTLPKDKYAGEFFNAKIGKVKISYENEDIIVRIGNLWAKATPFPEENLIRVELTPGRGRVIKFNIEHGLVQSISHQREIFEKI